MSPKHSFEGAAIDVDPTRCVRVAATTAVHNPAKAVVCPLGVHGWRWNRTAPSGSKPAPAGRTDPVSECALCGDPLKGSVAARVHAVFCKQRLGLQMQPQDTETLRTLAQVSTRLKSQGSGPSGSVVVQNLDTKNGKAHNGQHEDEWMEVATRCHDPSVQSKRRIAPRRVHLLQPQVRIRTPSKEAAVSSARSLVWTHSDSPGWRRQRQRVKQMVNEESPDAFAQRGTCDRVCRL